MTCVYAVGLSWNGKPKAWAVQSGKVPNGVTGTSHFEWWLGTSASASESQDAKAKCLRGGLSGSH